MAARPDAAGPQRLVGSIKVKKHQTVNIESLPDLLDTNQAAAILNVTPRTVTRMCEQGKLKAVRVMSLWRINRDRLLDFAGLN